MVRIYFIEWDNNFEWFDDKYLHIVLKSNNQRLLHNFGRREELIEDEVRDQIVLCFLFTFIFG